MSKSNASIGDKLERVASWEKLSIVAEEWRQSRSHDLDGLLLDLNRGYQHRNRPQVARAAVKLRSIHEKLVPALASIVWESCWTEKEDTPEERAHWAAVQKETEGRLAIWLRDFMTAIRNLELGLMFDEATTIGQAGAALPPAKKALFANIGKCWRNSSGWIVNPPGKSEKGWGVYNTKKRKNRIFPFLLFEYSPKIKMK